MSTPLILVTNDDGVHAPGIKALAAGLASLGTVHVVAPDREVSACAQSLTLKHPLRVNIWKNDRVLRGYQRVGEISRGRVVLKPGHAKARLPMQHATFG